MRATAVLPAGTWEAARCVGTVVLDHDDRHRRRIALRTEAGVEFLLDLPQAFHLRDGDGLVLDGDGIVRVCAKPEPLLDIRAGSGGALARIAWHLGNRHLPVQICERRLRIRADHVIADLIRRLGGVLEPVEAPFDPEAGAYSGDQRHAGEHDHR